MKNLKNIISKMTLEEKSSLCSGLNFWYLKGVDRLEIPSIMVTDGPHGLRKESGDPSDGGLNRSVPATCFPTGSALASTWNRDLIFEVGAALGEECRQEKVGVILGPGANIKRSPLGGRNFEYFSEDPYLSGEIAKNHINGVQSQGIGTSLKHFTANNQETRRMTIDTIVDERALREIYLAGYEMAIRDAQPWTVMCAYNKVNGTYASEHKSLMTDILKNEWGHKGLVVTDWGAMNDRVQGIKAGVELEMPGVNNGNDASLTAAVRTGELDESILDDSVERILNVIFKAQETLSEDFSYDAQEHHALARFAAVEGAVLLKNDAQLLPLKKNSRVALIGRFAKHPRYQGAGSSFMNPTQLDNLHDEVKRLVGDANLVYAPGYTQKGNPADETLIQQAVEAASQADAVIICAGLTDLHEIEGLDREDMKLPPGHDALIQKVAASHQHVVVVLSNGSPVEMPWINDVSAVLEGYLGGQAGAGAIADILFGSVSPSGKLAETFPLKLEDNPSQLNFPSGPAIVEYRESLYVGYRYYDSVKQDVLFPFGYGLSYTSFVYSDLELNRAQGPDGETVTVTLNVKNTGKMAGKEIVQVYVRDVESTVFKPEKELKGFVKIKLKPGEESSVSIKLDRRAFAFYDVGQRDWVVEAGDFEILVGSSSQDIHLRADLQISSVQKATIPSDKQKLNAYYNPSKGLPVIQSEFETLLGRPIPRKQGPKKGNYTINTPVDDLRDSFVGRLLFNLMQKKVGEMIRGQEDTPNAMMMTTMTREMPLRGLLMAGNESLTRGMLEALVVMMNGSFFKGLRALIKSRRVK